MRRKKSFYLFGSSATIFILLFFSSAHLRDSKEDVVEKPETPLVTYTSLDQLSDYWINAIGHNKESVTGEKFFFEVEHKETKEVKRVNVTKELYHEYLKIVIRRHCKSSSN